MTDQTYQLIQTNSEVQLFFQQKFFLPQILFSTKIFLQSKFYYNGIDKGAPWWWLPLTPRPIIFLICQQRSKRFDKKHLQLTIERLWLIPWDWPLPVDLLMKIFRKIWHKKPNVMNLLAILFIYIHPIGRYSCYFLCPESKSKRFFAATMSHRHSFFFFTKWLYPTWY